MQEANFSNTSIIDQNSLNNSAPNMQAPHKHFDNKEFSIMLPKIPNKKPLLDSIATLKSSYITFHSKILQRSQSYEELSSSSRVQEPKKDKNQSNGNINANQMIAETRSLNEKSAQPNPQKTSIPEGHKEENEAIVKEEKKSGGQVVEKEVSVLIQNSGLIKREISMINQDETLKNFIDELEFSQKEEESGHNEGVESSVQESQHEEDLNPKGVENSRKSSQKNSSSGKSSIAKENSGEISRESERSVESKRSLSEKEENHQRSFWGRVNKLSIVINLLLLSLVFMAPKTKIFELLTTNQELNPKEFRSEMIAVQEKPLMEIKNETMVTVEVIKDVREYREYQELMHEKEKLEKEKEGLKFKTRDLERRLAEMSQNFQELNSTHMKTLEKINGVKGKLEYAKGKMEKITNNDLAGLCSNYLRLIWASLFGENV